MDDLKPGRKFRVIIVGGGVAGLAMAHALQLANIDYTVLEKRQEVVETSGAGLGVWPQCVRILDQFRVLDAMKQISSPLRMSVNLNPDGSEISTSPLFDMVMERSVLP
jgi:2-polyprenyl-6-methoxyphenol hydroxylase-like FAD-dependent oxidoreductase